MSAAVMGCGGAAVAGAGRLSPAGAGADSGGGLDGALGAEADLGLVAQAARLVASANVNWRRVARRGGMASMVRPSWLAATIERRWSKAPMGT